MSRHALLLTTVLALPFLPCQAEDAAELDALVARIQQVEEVWRRGAEALPTPEVRLGSRDARVGSFRGLDVDAAAYLLDTSGLAPCVQFTDGRGISWRKSFERELGETAETAQLPLAAEALVLLMKSSSASTVHQQWHAMQRLRAAVDEADEPSPWAGLLAELEDIWQLERLARVLAATPEPDQYGNRPDEWYWAILAAGADDHGELAPRLAELAVDEAKYTSLAAERALEDMTSPAAEIGLAECVRGMQYNAADKAARALAERNAELLTETLLSMSPTGRDRYRFARMLAALDRVEAVPHLAATVHEVAMVDGKMFADLERLATREHIPLLEAMVERVRPEQRERAQQVLEAVRSKE